MPQMAPINWLILFLMFSLTFYMLMNMIYFIFIKKIKNNNKNNSYNLKNYNKFI